MSAESEFIVEFRNVSKSFGPQKVLRELNLKIPRGRTTFIIGRSGEGKSVTLKHIVGILTPDTGSVFFDDQEMPKISGPLWVAARQKTGLLFQDGALFDSMTVAENVSFAINEHLKLDFKETKKRIEELLELVGLSGIIDAYPPDLSIGEKKRVGLARALSLNPKLLLYDEPTTGMDSIVAELIDNLVIETQKNQTGLTSVVISHDLPSILNVAEHIILLHEGRVYHEGSPENFKQSKDALVVQFLTGATEGPLAKPIA